MRESGRDPGFDTLLDLHGQTLFVDEAGHWVKFIAEPTEVSPHRPRAQLFADIARTGRHTAGRVRQCARS